MGFVDLGTANAPMFRKVTRDRFTAVPAAAGSAGGMASTRRGNACREDKEAGRDRAADSVGAQAVQGVGAWVDLLPADPSATASAQSAGARNLMNAASPA